MSERTISRQRAYQLRQMAKGLCTKCGRKRSAENREYCDYHRKQRLAPEKRGRTLDDGTRAA